MIISKRFLSAGILSVGAFYVSMFAASLLFMCAPLNMAHAETIVSGKIGSDTVWTATGSPYVLQGDVFIVSSSTLTIGEGASVISRKPSEGAATNYGINVDPGGKIEVRGTPSRHVKIGGGVRHIFVWQGEADIAYADMQMKDIDLQLNSARASVSSSTFSHSGVAAIQLIDSDLDVESSRIENNDLFGVLVNTNDADNSIAVHNSAIADNVNYAVTNRDVPTIDISSNWWGSDHGPASVDTNKIDGPVKYDPWLTADPVPDLRDTVLDCCSSVLFIPGLEATRLYGEYSLPLGFGTTSDRYWEPLSNLDVQKLYLDQNGKSIDQTVYSGEPIDSALGIKGVYGGLMDDLGNLVKTGMIREWKSFGYDWRKPIDEVVMGQEKKAKGTESLIDTVSDLAKRSKTGKVTLIAHSNGGLVSKYLVKELQNEGKAGLIDKVISVAVPYLGTPQAILGLLHGADQSIAYGLIVKESVARGLGANMASAYSLLPSNEYFKQKPGPVISFASSTVTEVNSGKYPKSINDYIGESAFILGVPEARASSNSTNTSVPINGNSTLMQAALDIHNTIDSFMWPPNIVSLAIVGWDNLTASGIRYYEKTKCLKSLIGLSCPPSPVYEKIPSKMGDGTVMAESAKFGSGTDIFLDLKSVSTKEGMHLEHSNILESATTLGLVDSIITSPSATNTDQVLSSIGSLPTGVSVGKIESGGDSYLTVSTHSPVSLNIYDQDGNHTGEVDPPTGTEEVYRAYEEDIPGSDFSRTDEGDTYITLPDDGGSYDVELQGTGIGEFTLDVERISGGNIIDSVEYSQVPVTPLTVASTTVVSGANGNIKDKVPLSIDEDGDSNVDSAIRPDRKFDAIEYLETYKQTIISIAGGLQKGKNLVKRIDKLEELIRSGKLKKAKNMSSKLDAKLGHIKLKKLSDLDKNKIVDMFDAFLQQFE